MIAVIADDFTGAAEIGGVGLRYGLKVVIETVVHKKETPDLLIIATDTRSLPPEEASVEIEKITWQLMKQDPDFIYKKLDSVLRGNIANEINSQLSVLGKKKAILVPGNPNLGRIIKDGIYYVNGVPLSQTFFANDPEFPRYSSSVVDIIGTKDIGVVSKAIDEELPQSGIIVGDVTNQSDLTKWADRIDNDTIAAGGAGFFDVILAKYYKKKKQKDNETYYLNEKSLFVLGSLYPKCEKMISKISGMGLIKMNMPDTIYRNDNSSPVLIDRWADNVVRQLNKGQKVIVSIEHKSHNEAGLSQRIRESIGLLIQRIMHQVDIDDLLIEGGATTSEILKQLKIKKLYPFRELDIGIIQMKVNEFPNLCITTKPGSYSWPDSVVFQNKEMII